MKSKFDIHKAVKEWNSLLSSEDDDDDDDDLEDDWAKMTMNQIVTDKERDKNDTTRCEDFITEFLKGPEPYKFPYEDYQIIGDTTEIDKVIQTCGHINIDVADITSTLSTDTLNYVTVGIGGNIEDALKQSVDNLPAITGQVGKMLFQILTSKEYKTYLSEIKSVTDFIGSFNNDIDVCWGFAYDETLTDNIKVILIASIK